jgi:hypothetical protein
MGPKFPPPKIRLNVSSRIGCGAESVIHWATPAAMPSIPSVTRNDGMLSMLTRVPLTVPTITPTARPTAIPATTPQSEIAMAVQTLARPATEPTLRSISAAEITNVTPTAMIEIVAACRKMLSRLFVDVKPRSPRVTANARKTTTKPM